METNSSGIKGKGVSSSISSSGNSPASSIRDSAGVEPDPRWPSKCRWSVKSVSLPLTTPSKETVVSGATTSVGTPSPSALTQSLTISDIQGQPPLESGVSDLVLNSVSQKLSEPPPAIVSSPPSGNSKEAEMDIGPPIPLSVPEEVIVSVPSPNTLPVPQGAWAHPPKFTSTDSIPSTEMWPSLLESQKRQVIRNEIPTSKLVKAVTTRQEASDRKEDDLRFPWAARLNPSSRNLFRATEPEYSDDGTPKVTIPPHVLKQGVENQKEYVLGQFYRCSPPPIGLIHAVVNRIWGRKCRIFVRNLGDSKYLFHIPDASTRLWIIQRGLWHIDDCLMFVAPWTPTASLALPDIATVPVWLTLKNIPYLCYSIPGISHIASGLGAPMATHKPRLDPTLMGEAKILVEVELSKAFPPRIAVDDKQGCIAMVDVEYGWIPTKCGKCGQLGHKVSRCLQQIPTQQDKVNKIVPEKGGSDGLVADSAVVLPLVTMFDSAPSSETRVNTTQVIMSRSSPEAPVDTSQITIVEGSINQAVITNVKDMVLASTITQRVTNIAHPVRNDVPSKSQEIDSLKLNNSTAVENVLGDNRYSALGSLEMEEDSHDSAEESDMLDLMTPSGQRILRERPVKPSTKAMEMEASSKLGGRRGRGRGKRGGRG